ncbi:MAG: YgaP family membrane protein [Solirubrobacteraceae bacterium]
MKRPETNITPSERGGRIVIGGAAAIAGLILLGSTGGALAVVLEVSLVLAGLDLVLTGAIGHCPLYAKLGHVPRSLRRPA